MGHKPSAPTYNVDSALAEQNRLNTAYSNQLYADVNSPTGGYSTYYDPNTGQLTVNKTLSDNSQTALNLQNQVLGNYTGNGTDAANAYYNAQMAYAQPRLERQVTRGQTALTNRGIPLGGRAWNEYMGDIYDTQNQYRSNLANSAITAGQGYQSSILDQGNMLGAQIIDPSMVMGQAGAGLYDTYEQQYQNEIDKYKSDMARYNARTQAWMQALNPLGYMTGSAASSLGSNNSQSSNNIVDINGNVIGQAGGYGTYDPNYKGK